MGKILIEGIEIYAHHGFYKEEQFLGGKFQIDLEMEVDTIKAQSTDDLDETVNYEKVYQVIKIEMEKKSKLLEYIAARILDTVFKEFPMVRHAKVKLAKINPPIKGHIDRVSVILDRKR